MRRVTALVLAGGSTREMSVLTEMRAATAMPFGGKYRVIDFTLSNLCNSDIYHVGLLTQHAPLSLHAHVGIGKPWDLDHRDGGVILLQPYQRQSATRWYLGTADAVRQNLDVLRNARARHVLVLPGDLVYKMDYSWLLRAHQERGARITLGLSRIDPNESHRFGVCHMNDQGHIKDFKEKPPAGTPGLGFMGIAVVDTAYLEELVLGHPEGHNLVTDIIQKLIERGERVDGYLFEGYWEDIGTLSAYYRASMDLLKETPRLNLYDPEWGIYTRSEELPPARLGATARIESSLVASGCRVDGTVENSILFPGVRIEAGAVVRNSIIMNGSRIGAEAVVDRAILDKWVRVGPLAQIGLNPERPEDAPPHHELPDVITGGLVVVGREAALPAACHIGRHVIVEPGVNPEDVELATDEAGHGSGPGIPAGSTVRRRSDWVSSESPTAYLAAEAIAAESRVGAGEDSSQRTPS